MSGSIPDCSSVEQGSESLNGGKVKEAVEITGPKIREGRFWAVVDFSRRYPLGGIGADRVEIELLKGHGKLEIFHQHRKNIGIFHVKGKGQIQGCTYIVRFTLGGFDFLDLVWDAVLSLHRGSGKSYLRAYLWGIRGAVFSQSGCTYP